MLKSPLFGEVMQQFDGSNATGVFRITFQNKFYYYFTKESRHASYPFPLKSAWKDKIIEAAANVLAIPSTRARPDTSPAAVIGVTVTIKNEAGTTFEDQQPSPEKRPRLERVEPSENMSYWPNSPEA